MCRTSLRTPAFVVDFFFSIEPQGEPSGKKQLYRLYSNILQELAQEIQKHAPKGLSQILLTHDDFVPWKLNRERMQGHADQELRESHPFDSTDHK